MTKLPLPVRIANGAGALARAAGLPVVRLDPEGLCEAARRATGLADFGDPPFREGLEHLCRSWEEDAHLTLLGRLTARRDARRLLENRLRILDVLRRHPEIEARPVERPVFVIGLPRTGTTILHELLAQDPANRVPWTWEVMHPWPPPEAARAQADPRIEQVERHFGGIDRVLPEFKTMHPMGARLPQECVALMQHDFASLIFHTQFRVPSYQAWLDGLDHRPVYASHRRQLQYLQWRWPAERWVLKSPGHLWTLEALLGVYPDARLVFTHRDPVRVTASLANLVATLRSLGSDRVDRREIGADWAERLARGLEHAMAVRDAARLPDDRVVDVRFDDFVGNEIGSVQRIYEHLGMAFSAEAESRMRRFLAANPKDKHGTHRYRLDDAGLDEAVLRRRFAAYITRHL